MLRRVREIEPRIGTCLNYDATARRPEGALWPDLPKGCGAIGPQAGLVTDELFARAKAEGLGVHCWTVNDPAFAAQLARLGAASVISDDVSVVGPRDPRGHGRRPAAQPAEGLTGTASASFAVTTRFRPAAFAS